MERRIAVIVPVYNGEKYLSACIDSLMAQDCRDFSVLFVDDGSTDGSPALLDAAAQKDPRFRVIHKKNEGLMATWMRGLQETEEPYVMFLDCDDFLSPKTLSSMESHLPYPADPSVEEAEVISSNFVIERTGQDGTVRGEVSTSRALPGDYTGLYLERQIREDLLGNEQRTVILSRCMKLFSRKLLVSNLPYCNPKIRMAEDLNITVPALLDAKRVVLLPDAFYHYRFVKGSMVHHYDAGLYENVKLLVSTLSGIVRDKGVPGGEEMVKRESLYLFFLVLKNELRRKDCGDREVIERVQQICHEQNGRRLLSLQKRSPRDPANKILEFVLRFPEPFVILAARKLFLRKG